ncbi:MAG TPA: TMEM175 family protein [Acidimicrobiia bacterium]|nr:TMEM175 family protein [Acidimicrobiia bacterium]
MNDVEPTAFERGIDLDRVVNFSDAVFAIAMTVLVLAVTVPDVPSGRLGKALGDQLPAIWSYFLSFGVIALYWLAHHRLFHWVRRVDFRTLLLNLVLLSLIAIVPFPTDLLGRYGNTRIGTMSYAAAATAVGVASVLLWAHVSRTPGLLRPETPRSFVKHAQLRGITVPLVFALSIPIALWNVDAAKYFWIAIVPMRIALVRRFGSVYAPRPE